MFDARLRFLKDRVLERFARAMPTRVSPTFVTAVGLLAGLASALAAVKGALGLALVLFVLNRTLDGLDGLVARRFGKQTDLGGYLDLMADFVVYASIPIALVYAYPSSANLWSLVAMLASFYVNAASWMLLSALLAKRQALKPSLTSVEMPKGLIEGGETIAFYIAFLLVPQHLVWLMSTLAVFVLVSALQRVVWACRKKNLATP